MPRDLFINQTGGELDILNLLNKKRRLKHKQLPTELYILKLAQAICIFIFMKGLGFVDRVMHSKQKFWEFVTCDNNNY